jgi:flagellar protein FlgJ
MIDSIKMNPSLSQIAGEEAVKNLKNNSEELREVAEQFEAIFLNQFLKQARQAKLADDLFSNSASKTYTEMLDQQYATQLSSSVDLGIADGLMRQFGRLVE